MSHTLTDASLVGAVIADIRRQLLGDGLVRRGHLGEILAETHAAVTSAIAAWHRDLDELPMVVGSVDPALTSLLLARACIQDDAENEAVVRLLTRSREVTGTIAESGERLALHLMPVYTSVEYQVTSRISAVVSSDAAIYRARASLSAVIARSSFANA
jgi:prophage DNA circulation protein